MKGKRLKTDSTIIKENISVSKYKKLYSLISIIFLGAIGSGFWDLFLKDFFYFIGSIFVSIASFLYSGYFDLLYNDVGAQSNVLLILPAIFLIIMIIISPLFVFVFFKNKFKRLEFFINKKDNTPPHFLKLFLNMFNNHRIKLYLIIVSPFLLSSILYAHLLITSVSNLSAIRQVEQRITIIRPFINNLDYYKIMSEFREVADRNSLIKLLKKIDNFANENNKKLPKLKLYGVDI